MKKLAAASIVVISTLAWRSSIAQSYSDKKIAQIPGRSLKWIEAAESELHRRNLNINNYTVSVVDCPGSMIVVFSSPDQTESARGSVGKYPGYEVEISKKDMEILRSNYVR